MCLYDEQVVAEVTVVVALVSELGQQLAATFAFGAFLMDQCNSSRRSRHAYHEVIAELLCRS
jgi:hypothetical protein